MNLINFLEIDMQSKFKQRLNYLLAFLLKVCVGRADEDLIALIHKTSIVRIQNNKTYA